VEGDVSNGIRGATKLSDRRNSDVTLHTFATILNLRNFHGQQNYEVFSKQLREDSLCFSETLSGKTSSENAPFGSGAIIER
jgi:hypothetical protein